MSEQCQGNNLLALKNYGLATLTEGAAAASQGAYDRTPEIFSAD